MKTPDEIASAQAPVAGSDAPLLEAWFPPLARISRARLGVFPTPVERVTAFPDVASLWIKRDDLNVPPAFHGAGGNKVRALEYLLGDVQEGDTVLTLGGEGSTHVMATAIHAARLGARTVAYRWPHEMNAAARAVRTRADAAAVTRAAWTVVDAWLRCRLYQARHRARWIPLGGSTALGILGHANAALELAGQIAAGELPHPARVVVPLGSGGTAAGLALGFAIAGLDVVVVGARVGPRFFVTRRRVLALARSAAVLLERLGDGTAPRVRRDRVVVDHHVFGGAYGRPLAAAERLAATLERLHAGRPVVFDSTYSAKALAAAVACARRGGAPTLFWLTFDGRGLVPARDT